MRAIVGAVALVLLAAALPAHADPPPVRIGAKNFTEQEILGEIVAQLIERRTDSPVERRFGLGGTDICHAALRSGAIDLYVEYTGTALLTVLRREAPALPDVAWARASRIYRDRFDLEWLPPIGFSNSYAICVRAADAEANGWSAIGDLVADAETLRAGFTSEFIERPDGLPGMRESYGLSFGDVSDLDPGLMYRALAEGQVDVICAFSTDGRIAEYGLATLEDDRLFFPPYDAAPVARAGLLAGRPAIRDALMSLAGTIDDAAMRRMNHAVDVLGRSPAAVAGAWIDERFGGAAAPAETADGDAEGRRGALALAIDRRDELLSKTLEHLALTLTSTAIAICIGVPLGVLVHRRAAARGPVLAFTEVMQTIPSLAMLAFLFAIYGLLGAAPAITALVLYALLPIVLNTFTGLREVPRQIVQAADGVGMSSWQRLRIVELPLAAPVIIAGVRAATVLTVGIATLSTYIGAGGLGDFIARGLARNDTRLTLLGAVPAALLAVALSLGIRLIERAVRRG
ncbi:MAG: glycine betaine ABC transporter substrate-binding protein [Phycisphaerales bacterium]